MALVLNGSVWLYNHVINELADDRTKDLPLINSPLPVIVITAVYLLIVLRWAPKFMENRKPFNLRRLLIAYNFILMVVCAILIVINIKNFPLSEWKCIPNNSTTTNTREMMLAGYAYFILKMIELMDTFFIILKKNYRQISFLHVFHHGSMILFVWVLMKYFPGGQSFYQPAINVIVHLFMYGYYLLTAYDEKYKKNIWLKKKLTQLQLLQFGLVSILYTTPLIYDCEYPKLGSLGILLVNFIMIVLFSNFYYRTYIQKSKQM